ncbi:MAG: flagellar assembly protein FliH [Planctomycetaceae bacterium]|nr:flagellar assembly protein FliH [Planctomycetaceae bacterium]
MSAAATAHNTIVFPRRLVSVRTWEAIAAEPMTPVATAPATTAVTNSVETPAVSPPEPSAELLLQIDASLKALQVYEQQQQTLMRQTIVELAVVAAETVLGHAVRNGDYDIGARIEQAFSRFGSAGPLRIGLHPGDLEAARTLLDGTTYAESVQLEANASVAQGECLVSSPQETWCTNMTTQLETIRRAWLESIHDTVA